MLIVSTTLIPRVQTLFSPFANVSLGTNNAWYVASVIPSTNINGYVNTASCENPSLVTNSYATYYTNSAASDRFGNVYFTYGAVSNISPFFIACNGVYNLSGTTGFIVSGTAGCFTVWGAFVRSVWQVYCMSGSGVVSIA